ncbi:MAG: PKD domain-containing protein [Candidatus Diapherotrites archaeon]|nr:PKD domain-containing protein [Candidatus Diapherotrites archaeon]
MEEFKVKKKALALAFFLLLAGSIVWAAEKDVILQINGEDADIDANAVEVIGPGEFHLTGMVKNNLLAEDTHKNLDLVFILDASGSMQGEIDAVRDSINEIIAYVNTECPGCMRVSIYVFEAIPASTGGGGTPPPCHGKACLEPSSPETENTETAYFGCFSKKGYCAGDNDKGLIPFTTNADTLKECLALVVANGSVEPWARLTYEILNDNSFGWRSDAVKAMVVITDEPADPCSSCDKASCHSHYCSQAANTLLSKDAYFFGIYGIYGGAPGVDLDMQKILDAGVKGDMYSYDNTSEIKEKILQAIGTIIGSDDFVVTKELGPDWESNIGATGFSVPQVVRRDPNWREFQIDLKTPDTYDQDFAMFEYKIAMVDDPSKYDVAWLKVIMGENKLPTVSLSHEPEEPLPGEEVVFTADALDEDGTIVAYRWNFGDGETKECADCAVVSHTYAAKGEYLVSVEVEDDRGGKAAATENLKIKNRPPNKPVVTISPTSGFAPLETTMNATATDPDNDPIVQWQWDYDDYTPMDTCDCSSRNHTYTSDGSFSAMARASDGEDWSEWSDPIVTVSIKNVLTAFRVQDTNVGKKTLMLVSCTDQTLTALVEIMDSEGTLLKTVERECNGLWSEPDYVFGESGIYMARASIKGKQCSNCPKTIYFRAIAPFPEIKTPDASPLSAAAVLAAVLILTGRKKKK